MARVLIIEDNADNLELMTYLLECFGHATLSAVDGECGIVAAMHEHPDLIVCDIHLPGADGYAVACCLKSDPALARIPLIAVTALAMVGDRERVLAAGFDGYISKPIDPQRFVAELEAFLPQDRHGTGPSVKDEAPTPTPAPTAATHASILAVDDLPTNRELLRDTLQPFGYEVRLAHSVADALRLAMEKKPDLIVSDLHMPDADGFDLIRAIKADAELSKLPFILLSSSTWGNNTREKSLAMGISRFLMRPIEPQALIDEIAACLAGRG